MRRSVLLLLLCVCVSVQSRCWQGPSFPSSVLPPAVVGRVGGMVRVPAVPSVPRCVEAACDLPWGDVAWFFQGRCYVVSCQQRAQCRPQRRPGAQSHLTFIQRSPALPPALYWGEYKSSEAPGDLQALKDLGLLRSQLDYEDPDLGEMEYPPSNEDTEPTDQSEVSERDGLNQSEARNETTQRPLLAQVQSSFSPNLTADSNPDREMTSLPVLVDGGVLTSASPLASVEPTASVETNAPAHSSHITDSLGAAVVPSPSTPVQSVPVQSAPVQSTPVQSAPVHPAPVQSVPVQSTPVQSTPNQSAPVQSAPVQSAPVYSAPVQSAPVQFAPVQSAPVQSAPVHSASVQSTPVQSAPVHSAPVQSASVQSAPVQFAPVQSAPVQSAPVHSASVQSTPVQSAPVHSAPVQSAPVQSAPVQSAPVYSAPVQSTPVQSASVHSAPVQSAPVHSAPVQSASVQSASVQSAPVQSVPSSAPCSPPAPSAHSALLGPAPVAHAGGSYTLTLPNSSVVLQGSVTNTDTKTVHYLWTRDAQSPAAGEVLFGSDTRPSLVLVNLVEGSYLFHLRATDAGGRSASASATVQVLPEPGGAEEVELEMQVSVSQVSVSQRDTVVSQLSALLHVPPSHIHLRGLYGHAPLSTVLRFSVRTPSGPVPGSSVVSLLKNHLLRDRTEYLLFRVLRVDTVVCQLQCSGRGQCDPVSRLCLCDPFWTENLLRTYLGDGQRNCEWRVLYVILSGFILVILILSAAWTFMCCCRRKRQSKVRRKTRYTILDNVDEQERVELRPKFSLKHRSTEHNSSLMMSESELSDQDFRDPPLRSRNRTKAGLNRV